MNFYYFMIFTLNLFSSGEFTVGEYKEPDIIFETIVDGNQVQLEPFKSNQNNEIIVSNNKTPKLKWFSLGYPVFIYMIKYDKG